MFICAFAGNIAYHKRAVQRTASGNEYIAQYAVDGDTNSNVNAMHCAQATGIGSEMAWWWLDLAGTCIIDAVTIHGSDDGECQQQN